MERRRDVCRERGAVADITRDSPPPSLSACFSHLAVQPLFPYPETSKMETHTLILLLFTSSEIWFYNAYANEDEVCETLPSEIHITKEEFDELGRLQRTCNGDVAVNKCEGACNSQVQPSVVTPTGFLKECFCCRESFLRERTITLTHCYDPDGMRLTGAPQSQMDVRLREPAECKCYKCSDYSR